MSNIDPYVYPDTNVLVNKFNCQDAEKLREIEALSTGANLAYLQMHPVNGEFDFNHYVSFSLDQSGLFLL